MRGPAAVALYFYRLSGMGGGAERMICQLAGALAGRGFNVHLVSFDGEDATSFYAIAPSVQWTKLGQAPGYADKIRRVRALYRLLIRNDVEVLIGFVMSGDRTVYAAAKLAKVRLVAAERNAPAMYDFRCSALQRWVTFRLLSLADRITVQMEGFAAGYPKYLRGRIVTIPNPVPVSGQDARPDLADDGGMFTVLCVSRLEPMQKRIGCLVGAYGRIAARFPRWRLLIVGDGPEEEALHRRIEELGLVGRVSIEPSRPDIFDVYARSHLFVIPSRWEGFPNALAEAMSHGLPAIGFAQTAGVAELIGSDGGWLAVGGNDEAELAASLASAMADGEGRLQRGRNAARRMTWFTPDQQFDRWADLIRSLTRPST